MNDRQVHFLWVDTLDRQRDLRSFAFGHDERRPQSHGASPRVCELLKPRRRSLRERIAEFWRRRVAPPRLK